tara:strand:- start:141 stop:1406 length:1266 start_codon:yes stop_codon:yes gene_type:complete
MNSKNNYKLLIYSFLYISLLFGLFINEDLTIGYKADHYTHLIVIEFFNQNFFGTLLNFNEIDVSSHSPFFYIVYFLIKKISLNNDLILRMINMHISLFIPYLFYLILKTKNLNNKNILISLIPSIFFLSPYFRSGSFWIGSENISIVFLFASFYYYLLFKNADNKKFTLIILHIVFLSIAAYLRPIYSLFSLFFFISLIKDLIETKKIFYYIVINLFLAYPAFYYLFILKINFISIHINSDPISFSRFTNQFSMVVSILFFYSVTFLVFNFKKLIKSYYNFTNLLLFLIYVFILINYFNYNTSYGGGIFYRISSLIFLNNYFFYFISGLGFIFFKIILINNFKSKENINDIILFFTLLFLEIDRTIFNETYDIIIYPIFLIFFKNYYFSNFLQNFSKNKLLFLYCFNFSILIMSFIKKTIF